MNYVLILKLMKLVKIFKNFIWSKFPLLTRIYGAILNKKGFYTFQGWGLTTTSTFPPWVNILKNKLDFNNIFLKIDKDLKERIKKKKILLIKSFIRDRSNRLFRKT